MTHSRLSRSDCGALLIRAGQGKMLVCAGKISQYKSFYRELPPVRDTPHGRWLLLLVFFMVPRPFVALTAVFVDFFPRIRAPSQLTSTSLTSSSSSASRNHTASTSTSSLLQWGYCTVARRMGAWIFRCKLWTLPMMIQRKRKRPLLYQEIGWNEQSWHNSEIIQPSKYNGCEFWRQWMLKRNRGRMQRQ